jgi:hypothetical protein
MTEVTQAGRTPRCGASGVEHSRELKWNCMPCSWILQLPDVLRTELAARFDCPRMQTACWQAITSRFMGRVTSLLAAPDQIHARWPTIDADNGRRARCSSTEEG